MPASAMDFFYVFPDEDGDGAEMGMETEMIMMIKLEGNGNLLVGSCYISHL